MTVKTIQKRQKNIASNEIVTDFGTRKINIQNFSRTVVLPKTALFNCGDSKADQVNVQLVQSGNERYLKLIPTRAGKVDRSDHDE